MGGIRDTGPVITAATPWGAPADVRHVARHGECRSRREPSQVETSSEAPHGRRPVWVLAVEVAWKRSWNQRGFPGGSGASRCASAPGREHLAEYAECLRIPLALRAEADAHVRGHVEAIARRDQHARLREGRAQRTRVASVARSEERRVGKERRA